VRAVRAAGPCGSRGGVGSVAIEIREAAFERKNRVFMLLYIFYLQPSPFQRLL
jgi:hypothetical protein